MRSVTALPAIMLVCGLFPLGTVLGYCCAPQRETPALPLWLVWRETQYSTGYDKLEKRCNFGQPGLQNVSSLDLFDDVMAICIWAIFVCGKGRPSPSMRWNSMKSWRQSTWATTSPSC